MSMKPSIPNDQQLRLFPDSEELTVHSSKPLIVLPENKQSKRINHMTKFKSLHESQKPLMHLMPESYLEYIGKLIPHDHLCRIVKEVVFSLDTEPIEAKYSFLGQNSYHPKLLLIYCFTDMLLECEAAGSYQRNA